jgi:hypothetical protein
VDYSYVANWNFMELCFVFKHQGIQDSRRCSHLPHLARPSRLLLVVNARMFVLETDYKVQPLLENKIGLGGLEVDSSID